MISTLNSVRTEAYREELLGERVSGGLMEVGEVSVREVLNGILP